MQDVMTAAMQLCPHMLDLKARRRHLQTTSGAAMLAAFLDLLSLSALYVSVQVQHLLQRMQHPTPTGLQLLLRKALLYLRKAGGSNPETDGQTCVGCVVICTFVKLKESCKARNVRHDTKLGKMLTEIVL
eukprot:scaffold104915_cov19-Tisochrysis_lutea.AAC.1